MSEIKLLALDLDGTLFTKDKQVTAENRAALKAAAFNSVNFFKGDQGFVAMFRCIIENYATA